MKPSLTVIRTAVACAALALSCAVCAADPANGTITPDAPKLSFTGGPFLVPNVSTQGEVRDVAGDPVCQSTPGVELICDKFALKLDLPADYYTTNPQAVVKLTMSWPPVTNTPEAADSDYDFLLLDSSGAIIMEGEGTTNPETMVFCAAQGAQDYTIEIIPWAALGTSYQVDVEMVDEPKAHCKKPKAAEAKSDSLFGGLLNLALLLPLLGLAALRRKKA